MAILELDTHPGHTLALLLFSDVSNSRELLQALQKGSLLPELSLFNAYLIPDTFPLLAAADKTLVAQNRGSLVTRTLSSEFIYNYSGSKHITESLRRCGIADNSNYILVARFNATPDEIDMARKLVHGNEVDLEQLATRADKSLIQKHYKISSLELEISSLADAITCRIAARDAL